MRQVICCLTLVMVMLIGFSIGVVQAGPCELPDFDSAKFTNPTKIDNPYFPLSSGDIFVYEPVPNEDDVVNTMKVTHRTRKILGVKCIVVYDVETVGGVKTEVTYDWYAQDDDGNVWYMGEATKSLQPDGSWSTEGSWEAGVDDALPGYLMLAEPIPGVCYQQEFYEGEAEDRAKVLRLNAEVTLVTDGLCEDEDGDSCKDCLVTKEWTQLSPGDVEHKYYKSGLGLVLIEELKEKSVRVELVDIY